MMHQKTLDSDSCTTSRWRRCKTRAMADHSDPCRVRQTAIGVSNSHTYRVRPETRRDQNRSGCGTEWSRRRIERSKMHLLVDVVTELPASPPPVQTSLWTCSSAIPARALPDLSAPSPPSSLPGDPAGLRLHGRLPTQGLSCGQQR